MLDGRCCSKFEPALFQETIFGQQFDSCVLGHTVHCTLCIQILQPNHSVGLAVSSNPWNFGASTAKSISRDQSESMPSLSLNVAQK